MKIIDFELLGNVVKFYLGKDDLQRFYGDDWDDAPYDCNAGEVYDEFVSGVREIAFPSSWVLLEPKDDSRYYRESCPFCKDDFFARKVPCVIAVKIKDEMFRWQVEGCFSTFAASDNPGDVVKFYIGDKMNPSDALTVFDQQI